MENSFSSFKNDVFTEKSKIFRELEGRLTRAY
jgi:hypothetical protein